ncbi:MAG: hypothetical protein R3330_10195, partial [Saprospiraceae bacterium]|nr:hypothetical protein [Saprospiraceae bacterium]
CEGSSVLVGDSTFTESGLYSLQLTSSDGCDSIVDLDLTVSSQIETNLTVDICEDESYTLDGQTYTETGEYTAAFTSSAGCDSIVVVDLTVHSTSTGSTTLQICEGESIIFGSQVLTQAGSYSHTFQNQAGCDSTVNLQLTVLTDKTTNLTDQICQGESVTVGSESFTATGVYFIDFVTADGCDSTVVLDLLVHPQYISNVSVEICEGEAYEVGGQSYDNTGNYTVNLQTGAGCDSIINLDLSVVQSKTTDLVATICAGDSYSVGPETYQASGNYSLTLASATGCDSVVNLNLTVLDTIYEQISTSICSGETFSIGNQSFSATGMYEIALTSVQGCDSVIVLDLAVEDVINVSVSESICLGESVTIGGTTFDQPGTFNVTLTSRGGCDSIVTLDLEVTDQINKTISESICAGESYTLGAQVITTSGTYTGTFTGSGGCDSIVTLNLTVLEPILTLLEENICSGESYTLGTQVLTSPGTYTENFIGSGGCDSTVTLNLQISENFTEFLNVTICPGDSYLFGGTVYTTAGAYTENFSTKAGCDSIVTLNLSVNDQIETHIDRSICAGETYTLGTTEYSTPGIYSATFTTSSGCD